MLKPDIARIHAFEVTPSLPEPLKPLLKLANNLWWSWHPEAVELFRRLDQELWEQTHHNPVRLLGLCPQETLDEASRDDGFLNALSRVMSTLERRMVATPWMVAKKIDPGGHNGDPIIAYFSAEFGLTECLQIYSGGLGCLAGDHLKSASELRMPLVGVGLLYRHGYFQQYLNADGWQQEYYLDLDFANLPLSPALNDQGEQIKVNVELPGRTLHIAVWKVLVGAIVLYLLDTNLPENNLDDRGITGHLYGGDMEMRIKQEIVLGVGGMRALKALGVRPECHHMNEGHSAFLALEHIRELINEHNIGFDEARQQAASSHVFTTHTPVPAGIDRFPPDMIARYFRSFHDSLKLDMEGLLALGRENVYNKSEFFSMAVLAIRTSEWVNGVSQLHAKVSRDMWSSIWPTVPNSEVPIAHVTNGVHARSWLSADLISLLDRHLGNRWQNDPADHKVWKRVQDIPIEELWQVHCRRRQHLITWTRQQLRNQLQTRGANTGQIQAAIEQLRPDALTIGFARRFATYKRGTLFLRDPKRLMKLLADNDRPIQFIIAGKAHPADGGGKDLIRQLVSFANQTPNGHKIVFVENYDINVARYLVQGCDIWLNTPRRGMEASGTSGMKAALNGVLNCSIMDGWWDEAYQSEIGWQIGRGEDYAHPDMADDIESRTFYDLLESQIIPMFYDRDEFAAPRRWVGWMKRCIASLAPQFNTNRMVQEYAEKLYLPAIAKSRKLKADGLKTAIALSQLKQRLRRAWTKISIEQVQGPDGQSVSMRQPMAISAVVQLADLAPSDVCVQAYLGSVDNDGRLISGEAHDLTYEKDLGDGRHQFSGQIQSHHSGRQGFAVRITPGGEMAGVAEPGLIRWESASQAPAAVNKSRSEEKNVA